MPEEEVEHLIAEIEKKHQTDFKATLNLLQLVLLAEVRLETIERINAEKRVRKIVAAPLMGSFSADKEEVKKRCRELISKWGNIRRE